MIGPEVGEHRLQLGLITNIGCAEEAEQSYPRCGHNDLLSWPATAPQFLPWEIEVGTRASAGRPMAAALTGHPATRS